MNDSLQARAGKMLGALFQNYNGAPFAIRLWDGWTWRSAEGARPVCTIVLSAPKALELLIAGSGEVALGEAFIRGQADVEGDLFSVFEVAQHVVARPLPLRVRVLQALTAAARTVTLGQLHGRRRDSDSIACHYDQPVEFYQPWLGPTMVYSCAYFEDAADSLDAAQAQKLDLICRKLRLARGERFLDIGCGWGSLILHAAAEHGANACGITLSRSQAKVAAGRIVERGLMGRCRVRLEDYRELDRPPERGGEVFDKIASVGMAEHVGLKNLPVYFGIAYRRLRPGGVFLNHAIARSAGAPSRGNDSFVKRYVFPDGELTTLTEMLDAAEAAGFEVRDVENLREHYEKTLRCWVEALRKSEPVLRQHVTETIYRIWLLYMAGSAAAFRRGDLGVYQVLLSRPGEGKNQGVSGLPLTRDDWYVGPDIFLRRPPANGERRAWRRSITDVLN